MFMENHASARYGVTGPAALIRMIAPGSRVQLIAVDDIGAFAALAFADPVSYTGTALELAGDELTREDLVAAIVRATGLDLDVSPVSREALAAQGVNVGNVRRGGSFGGWQADIPALRRLHPGLMTFDAWLARGGAARFGALL